MFETSRFSEKLAVVAGAEHPLASALCQRLARHGAVVVAVGHDEDALDLLARKFPKQIEPLALRPGKRNMLELLEEAWGSEPLHFYADFLALRGGDGDDAESFSQGDLAGSLGVGRALKFGMQAGSALCVLVFHEPDGPSAPDGEKPALAGGYRDILKRFSRRDSTARHVGLRLSHLPDDWAEADIVSAADMLLTLFHPATRGMCNGSVVDWRPSAP